MGLTSDVRTNAMGISARLRALRGRPVPVGCQQVSYRVRPLLRIVARSELNGLKKEKPPLARRLILEL